MAGEDPHYMEWLRSQPCAACGHGGFVVVHHRNGAGMGLRAHDHKGIPLHNEPCHISHLHRLRGPFDGWNLQQMRDWQDTQIREHRARYASGGLDLALPY